MLKELRGLKGISSWHVYNKVIANLIFIRRFNEDERKFLDLLASLISESDIKIIREKLPLLVEFKEQVNLSPKHCLKIFKSCDRADRSEMIIEAISHANIDDDEVLRLLAVHEDENGVGFCRSNVDNLNIGEILNMIIETLLKCSYTDCDMSLLTEENIKESNKYRISIKEEVASILEHNPDLGVSDLLSIAIKKHLRD